MIRVILSSQSQSTGWAAVNMTNTAFDVELFILLIAFAGADIIEPIWHCLIDKRKKLFKPVYKL